jgi:ferredoxin
MSNITIPKTKMREICGELMKDKKVVAPVSNGKRVDYSEVSDVNSILMDDQLPYKSPKENFFPRCEKIIEFKDGEAVASKPEKGVVIFGAKPCDLEAIKIMTKVFTTGRFVDPFFSDHLANTVIIGVGCVDTKPGCFCDQRETYMKYSKECDLFLENKDDSYEVLYVSDKGKEALAALIPDLDGFANPEIEVPVSDKKQLTVVDNELELFEKINWDKMTDICQACGMCTYICPTCHCFEFKDVEEDGVVGRYRKWDSCMYPKFTLHASGHNPRDTKKERYRQRVLHKYLYVKKNFGYVACTGCGRCVRSCPAGMNIKTIVEGIMEELS